MGAPAGSRQAGTAAKVLAREVFRPIATRPAAMPTPAATPSMTGTPSVATAGRRGRPGRRSRGRRPRHGRCRWRSGGFGERVKQVGRAVDQFGDRHVDRDHAAAVLEAERADDAVAVGDGAGRQCDHDEPMRHQAGGLQRGLGHPDDRAGGDLAGRGHPGVTEAGDDESVCVGLVLHGPARSLRRRRSSPRHGFRRWAHRPQGGPR